MGNIVHEEPYLWTLQTARVVFCRGDWNATGGWGDRAGAGDDRRLLTIGTARSNSYYLRYSEAYARDL
jgi:hypothetical protein